MFYPLSAAGEERVVERSKDRVSKMYERYGRQSIGAPFTHPDYATLVGPPLFACGGKRAKKLKALTPTTLRWSALSLRLRRKEGWKIKSDFSE